LRWFKETKCQLHLAIENRGNIKIPYADKVFYIKFARKLFSLDNISSYFKLKDVIDKNEYDLIHCHTPVAGALTRIAAKKSRKKGTVVLYTVHGFHFYKGAPLKYWLFYYPIEYFLSAFTDGIITINKEDYSYIRNKMFHKYSFYINGIGFDSNKFKTLSLTEKSLLRKKYGYRDNDFILIYIAEFIPRKNHQFVIESLPGIIKIIPELKIIFAGDGILLEKMKSLSKKLHVGEHIDFVGFRTDANNYAAIADVGISSSRHEGLGLGIAEEMQCSLPIIVSEDKGHREMISHGVNGFLYAQGDKSSFVDHILTLYNDPRLRFKFGKNSLSRAQKFSIDKSLSSMNTIYINFIARIKQKND
jgi:glycosyltransferase EpsD